MRPKKVLLLIDSNETTQSTMRFLLEVNGYRVVSAANEAEAMELSSSESVDLTILRDRGRSVALSAFALRLKDHLDAPLMFISQHKEQRADDPYYDFIQWEHEQPIEFVKFVRILTSRKRGPKTIPDRKPVQRVYPDPFMDYIRGRA